MKAAKVIAGLLALFITLPIWFFLLHQVLVAVQASELMWFLYWIYVPVSVLIAAIAKIAEEG